MPARSPCPVCASTDFEALREAAWDICGLGRIHTAFGLCLQCGHIQQNPMPPAALLNAYYQRFSNYLILDDDWVPPPRPQSLMTERLLAMASSCKPDRGRLYEIGCGYGYHLQHFRNAGWDVRGCDPSPDSSRQARERVGLNVHTGYADACLDGQGVFDLILLCHVLEHVDAPRDLVGTARDHLAPDGILLIEVPCARTVEAIGPSWLMFEHLSYFSEVTLTRLLQSCAMEIVALALDDHCFHYPTITVACRKQRRPSHGTTCAVDASRSFLSQVIKIDRARWQHIDARLSGIEEAYLWGAGLHTSDLFAQTSLRARTKIKAVIDSSPLKQGQTLAALPVISPGAFQSEQCGQPVIVSSFSGEAAITAELRVMGLDRTQIVTLYGH